MRQLGFFFASWIMLAFTSSLWYCPGVTGTLPVGKDKRTLYKINLPIADDGIIDVRETALGALRGGMGIPGFLELVKHLQVAREITKMSPDDPSGVPLSLVTGYVPGDIEGNNKRATAWVQAQWDHTFEKHRDDDKAIAMAHAVAKEWQCTPLYN